MDQLNDNLGAVELNLSTDEIAKLNEVSTVDPGYPYRFIQNFDTRL
jgi:aryl-alcohol dehydrogenase-like predicted oxidoreductase